MSDIGDEKIRRWRLRIAECHIEAESLGPDGQSAIGMVIESYERLIRVVQGIKNSKT